jgi:hypothetical protein
MNVTIRRLAATAVLSLLAIGGIYGAGTVHAADGVHGITLRVYDGVHNHAIHASDGVHGVGLHLFDGVHGITIRANDGVHGRVMHTFDGVH